MNEDLIQNESPVKNPEKHKRPPMTTILFAALMAAAVVIIFLIVNRYWHFSNMKTEVSDASENTLVYNYEGFQGNILKYASDSAVLVNSENQPLWSVTYEMNQPEAVIYKGSCCIFDKGGTYVYTFNKSGESGHFNTTLPILKGAVSSKGTVAFLTGDKNSFEILYTDKSGSPISTIKVSSSKEGIPMDIALSPNGMTLGVSYLSYLTGGITSSVKFYSFNQDRMNENDNIIGDFTYEGSIIPEIDFQGSNRAFAVAGDKIIFYFISNKATQRSSLPVSGEIESVFTDGNYMGLVSGRSGDSYTVSFYKNDGSLKTSITCNFPYLSIFMRDGLLIMYNRNQLCIYSSDGVEKFNKETDGFVRQISFVTKNRYVMSKSDSFNIVRLF